MPTLISFINVYPPVWNYIEFMRYGILEFCVILLRVEHALVCGI